MTRHGYIQMMDEDSDNEDENTGDDEMFDTSRGMTTLVDADADDGETKARQVMIHTMMPNRGR
jgi:hypothetical protein